MQEFWPLSVAWPFSSRLALRWWPSAACQRPRARRCRPERIAALGLSVIGYVATGFALEYGGVGLALGETLPGAQGLIWEWSAIGETWGAGWGMAGLAGWGLTGAAATTGAYRLALATLPWLVTATLIPLIALRGRRAGLAAALLGLAMGALIYPLAGNWIWGGGWLAGLGDNLRLGHGFVDPGGGRAGASVGSGGSGSGSGGLRAAQRRAKTPAEGLPALPPVHLPLLAVTGAMLLLVGLPAWILSNPLLGATALDAVRLTLNVGAGRGPGRAAALALHLVCHRRPRPADGCARHGGGDHRSGDRGRVHLAGGCVGAGAAVGLLTPLVIYLLDHVMRVDDPAAVLVVHGVAASSGFSQSASWRTASRARAGTASANRATWRHGPGGHRSDAGGGQHGRLARPASGAGDRRRCAGRFRLLRSLAVHRTLALFAKWLARRKRR